MSSGLSSIISQAPCLDASEASHRAVQASVLSERASLVSERLFTPLTSRYPATIKSPPFGNCTTAFAASSTPVAVLFQTHCTPPVALILTAKAFFNVPPSLSTHFPVMTTLPSDSKAP